jgi:hypothetical protein
MITINDDQLEQLEFLLDQSMQGMHHLFDRHIIYTDLRAQGEREFTPNEVKRVHDLLNKLVSQPTISMKRAFVGRLQHNDRRILLRSYFNIVENTIYDSQCAFH